MNYRRMSIKDGSKYPAFWWYAIVELLLIAIAILSVSKGHLLEAVSIFILIEIREINQKIKDS